MAASRVRLIHQGMDQLAKSKAMSDEMERRGRRVAARAESTAVRVSGEYAKSIEVIRDETDRAVARVRATVPYALHVESAHRTLGEALDAAGEG